MYRQLKTYEGFTIAPSASPSSQTACDVMSNIINQIQSQLTTMFPPTGTIGAVDVTLTVNNKSTNVEMISPSDLTFTTSASDLGLPSYLSCSSQASLLGANNVWDKFTILAGVDASSSFALFLPNSYTQVISSSGAPACSNLYGVLDVFFINDITISNFFTFNLTATTSSSACLPLSSNKIGSGLTYKMPFIFQNTPISTFSINSTAQLYSSECPPVPLCPLSFWDMFDACVYETYCAINPSEGPCPLNTVLLPISPLILNGTVTVTTNIYVSAMISFEAQYINGTYTISNIEIIDVQDAQIESTYVAWNLSDSTYLSDFLKMLGGVSSIEDNVNKLVLKQLNNFTPKIISAINQELATLTFTL